MKTKPLTFLLALTFLFLFCGSVFGQQAELNIESHYKNGNEVEAAQINNDADDQEKRLQIKCCKSLNTYPPRNF